ncbi:MAG: T9SS type A sorting domain-containing protein [Bacteroidetes bacterium]|nr:T9SS type A sorting domain-containing protein [Bacteroidota bacterium]
MKNLTILILASLLIQLTAFSQSCLPEGIDFETQNDIDNFQANYPGCTEIEGNVTIGKFMTPSNITNLNGLNVLISVWGFLDIRLNDNLASLSGLDNLISVGGLFSIYNNQALTNCTGLEALTQVGGLIYIAYNDGLVDLTGLENLNTVGGNFVLRQNEALTSLMGIENLTTIGGGLEIRGNDLLTNILDLDGLTTIGDHLWIAGNDELGSLQGLEGVTTLPGYLDVGYANALEDLTGLGNITAVNGYLDIHDNEMLSSLAGLENIAEVGDNLSIHANSSLTSLIALSSLTSINGQLIVSENPLIVSLAGLDNIEASTITNLWVHDNISLSTCDIESVCNYLAAPAGAIYIVNNASGCANADEVEEACFTSIQDVGLSAGFSISPNPVSDFIKFHYQAKGAGAVIFLIVNITGTEIKEMQFATRKPGNYEFKVDVSEISAGIYFCVLKTNEGMQTRKIVRL